MLGEAGKQSYSWKERVNTGLSWHSGATPDNNDALCISREVEEGILTVITSKKFI